MITCKDEELHIQQCIESARSVADEIVVADSGSKDSTLAIVRGLGYCRVIEREFISYADFKNWPLPQCKHEWVLILDADERVTPELVEEIRELLQSDPAQDAYWCGGKIISSAIAFATVVGTMIAWSVWCVVPRVVIICVLCMKRWMFPQEKSVSCGIRFSTSHVGI